MKIPKFLKRKRNVWIIAIVVVLILVGFLIFGKDKTNASIQTANVARQDLQQTVLATGQVVSAVDLSLSFQGNGTVRNIYVQEGDKVAKGKLLASLDTSSASAVLTTAKGALAQAQANYDKLIAGATRQTVQTSQDTVNSAKQDVTNAYNGAITTLNTAHTNMYNAYASALSVYTSYFTTADQEGIKVTDAKKDMETGMDDAEKYLAVAEKSMSQEDIDSAISKFIIVLNHFYDDLSIVRLQEDQGVYYTKVSDTEKSAIDTQKAGITTSLSAVNSLQSNIASLKLAYQKAQNQLSVTTAPPTQAEIDLSEAQILSAKGQVASAQAGLNNLLIYAPADGIITKVDIKTGEQATAFKEAIILQDVGNLHTEANVSEANVASLEVGQTVDYTFDALGPDEHFAGKVLTINPASTVISGVVNYKVTGSLDNVPKIKPGMTANMTIMVAQKQGVLAVPSTAIINKNSAQYVRVVDDAKTKTYHEVQVQTGLQADGGLVEILSGLNDGQEIVTFMK